MSWEEFALGATKLLRVRVFRRHASVRFPPRVDFIPKLILGIPPFCVKRGYYFVCCRGNTHDTDSETRRRKKSLKRGSVRPGQRGKESHCKVSALSVSSLLCAATFMLQQLLRFVCA